jgi:hypothetical protein
MLGKFCFVLGSFSYPQYYLKVFIYVIKLNNYNN